MNILITGANGFLGKNLIEKLIKLPNVNIMHYARGTSKLLLEDNLKKCDFLFHFAAVHRPTDSMEFYRVNDDFFEEILQTLEKHGNGCPVLLTSSIQASDNTDYGRSKIIAENLLIEHAKKMNSRAIIYRLRNTFGKWATPNLHSVVATFCYNINRDIPIHISNRNISMNFYYVDDVIESFVNQIEGNWNTLKDGFAQLGEDKIIAITLGALANRLYEFRKCQKKNQTPNFANKDDQRLWETYLSYSE